MVLRDQEPFTQPRVAFGIAAKFEGNLIEGKKT